MLLAFAVSLFVGCLIEVIVLFAFLHREAWPWLTDHVFYLDTIRPEVWQPAQILRGIGLCFPIPLFALVWDRLTNASNQTMQPTASPRTASLSDD
jgi:hypothetical protein